MSFTSLLVIESTNSSGNELKHREKITKSYIASIFTAKIPYGKNSGRRKCHTTKFPYGEITVQQKLRIVEIPYGKKSYSEKSNSEKS